MSLKLTNKNIADTIDAVRRFCKDNKIDDANAIQSALALEETLIAYQEQFGEDGDYTYLTSRLFGTCKIILKVQGIGYNPLDEYNDSILQSELLSSMLRRMIYQPSYNFAHGSNEITFPLKRQAARTFKLSGNTLSLIIGLIAGFLFINLPEGYRVSISSGIINPIYSTIIGVLLGITIPFIFISLISCIASIGDVNVFKKLGMNIIKRIAIMALLTTAIGLAISTMLFPLQYDSQSSIMSSGNFLERILALLPTNAIIPFLRNNSIQVVFIALFLGICALILGDKIINLKTILSEVNTLMIQAMDIVAKLNYPLIVLSIITLINSAKKDLLLSFVKVALACVLINLSVIVIYCTYILIRHKKSPLRFIKIMMPAINIGFITTSTTSAMMKNYDLIESKAHIDPDIHDLWNPLTFALGSSTVVFLTIGTIFIANYNHIAVNSVWFIMAFLLIFQMSFAAPKVQGGVIAAFTLLFSQLGLPVDSLGLLSAANTICINMSVGFTMMVRELDLYDLALSQKAIKE